MTSLSRKGKIGIMAITVLLLVLIGLLGSGKVSISGLRSDVLSATPSIFNPESSPNESEIQIRGSNLGPSSMIEIFGNGITKTISPAWVYDATTSSDDDFIAFYQHDIGLQSGEYQIVIQDPTTGLHSNPIGFHFELSPIRDPDNMIFLDSNCPGTTFDRDLTWGSSGNDVVALQKFLITKGYLSTTWTPNQYSTSAGITNPIYIMKTGTYGLPTMQALAAYQTAKNISPANGYFDTATRAAVTADCRTDNPLVPIISSISPTYPVEEGSGSTITITGSGFTPTNNTIIFNSGERITGISSTNGTSLSFALPSFVGGGGYSNGLPVTATVYLTVSNSNGISNAKSIRVTPNLSAPSISSITPTSALVGTTVTITGTGFTPTGNRIKFGDLGSENNPSYSINSSNGTTLTFTVPTSNYLACWSSNPACLAPATLTQPGPYQVSVINTNGTSSSRTFTVTPGTPTAVLTANGSNNLTITAGENIAYNWSSANAVKASSTYTTNLPRCGVGGAWLANTLTGSIPSAPIPISYSGCIFTITYTTTNSAGVSTNSVLTVTISAPAITASLKANGSTGSVTVHTGERVKYEWSSTGAGTASSTYSTNLSRCGAGGPWNINKPNGALVSAPLPASYAGCIFTINFTASQALTGAKATSTVVLTVN